MQKQTSLQISIHANIDQWFKKALDFKTLCPEELDQLAQRINSLSLNDAVMEILESPRKNLVTEHWEKLREKDRSEKKVFFFEVANELGYSISKRFFHAKCALLPFDSPFNKSRFNGPQSVPELTLKYGHHKTKEVKFATKAQHEYLRKLVKKQGYFIPHRNNDMLLGIEASLIIDCFLEESELENWMLAYFQPTS